MITLTTLLVLIGAHYVADFAMQNDYMATAKADTKRPDLIHALTAHSAHHAVAAGVALEQGPTQPLALARVQEYVTADKYQGGIEHVYEWTFIPKAA